MYKSWQMTSWDWPSYSWRCQDWHWSQQTSRSLYSLRLPLCSAGSSSLYSELSSSRPPSEEFSLSWEFWQTTSNITQWSYKIVPVNGQHGSTEANTDTLVLVWNTDIGAVVLGDLLTRVNHHVEQEELLYWVILDRQIKLVAELGCVEECPGQIFPQIELLPLESEIDEDIMSREAHLSWGRVRPTASSPWTGWTWSSPSSSPPSSRQWWRAGRTCSAGRSRYSHWVEDSWQSCEDRHPRVSPADWADPFCHSQTPSTGTCNKDRAEQRVPPAARTGPWTS